MAEPQQPRQQPPPQLSVEEIISNANLPDRAKSWLRQHPEYLQDQRKNSELQVLHGVAARQAGSEYTDAYFERMDDLLGLRPATNGHANGGAIHPRPTPAPQPQQQAPVQRQAPAVPYSAPPTRDVPSLSTGRPMYRSGPLNADEKEVAASMAQTLGISQAE